MWTGVKLPSRMECSLGEGSSLCVLALFELKSPSQSPCVCVPHAADTCVCLGLMQSLAHSPTLHLSLFPTLRPSSSLPSSPSSNRLTLLYVYLRFLFLLRLVSSPPASGAGGPLCTPSRFRAGLGRGGAVPKRPQRAAGSGDWNRSWSRRVSIQSFSRVRLLTTPWTAARQAPLVHGFSRQESWSGFPFPSPGDLPSPGITPAFPALTGGFFTIVPPGKPPRTSTRHQTFSLKASIKMKSFAEVRVPPFEPLTKSVIRAQLRAPASLVKRTRGPSWTF